VNQTERETFLQANEVLGANGIGAPQRFVEVFSTPAAKLGSAVIHIIKGAEAFHDTLQLSELSHIASGIERRAYVDGDGEPDFIRLVREVAGNYVVPACSKEGNQSGANRA
jgi:hypothetical protein